MARQRALRQASQGLGPAQAIDALGVLHLFGIVTIGTGHAAAAHRHRLQGGTEAAEQGAPVTVGRWLGGLLGAVGEQIPGLGAGVLFAPATPRQGEQPLLGQQHLEVTAGRAERLHVFVPITEHQGGSTPTMGMPSAATLLRNWALLAAVRAKARRKPFTCWACRWA